MRSGMISNPARASRRALRDTCPAFPGGHRFWLRREASTRVRRRRFSPEHARARGTDPRPVGGFPGSLSHLHRWVVAGREHEPHPSLPHARLHACRAELNLEKKGPGALVWVDACAFSFSVRLRDASAVAACVVPQWCSWVVSEKRIGLDPRAPRSPSSRRHRRSRRGWRRTGCRAWPPGRDTCR